MFHKHIAQLVKEEIKNTNPININDIQSNKKSYTNTISINT